MLLIDGLNSVDLKQHFCASPDGIKWMLTDFADIYEEAGYERLPYSIWKKLKKAFGNVFFEKVNNKFGQTGVRVDVPLGDDIYEAIFFPYRDNSFGEHLWNNFEFIRDHIFWNITNKNINDNERKDNDIMNFNFDFGPLTNNDNVRMSIYGLAVKNSDGVWVSYDKAGKQIIDVDVFNFDGRRFMYKMPVAVKDVAVGDVVIHKHVPMFVESVKDGIHVVDVFAGERKEILPTVNMFNLNFVTKIVSFVDFSNAKADENNPFGNMLPFMLLADGANGSKSDIDPLMLMMFMNGGQLGDFSKNPLMMYFLFGNKGNNDMLLPLMMMNGGFQFPGSTNAPETIQG